MLMDQRPAIRSLPMTELADCYRRMVEIRLFECLAEEAAAGGHIRGMIHSAVGQEAVAVGVCRNLRRDDLIASTHRNHHHALAKGVPARAAMAELLGRVTGSCGGKGGSMHIADVSTGMYGANGVVGASAVIAVGLAQALRFRRSDGVAVAFIGDGAVNRGQCLEAMNYAAVYRLPLLIVCEDNGWAATTRASTVTAGPGAVHRARALGLRAAEADGNDIEAVASLTRDAVGRARGIPCPGPDPARPAQAAPARCRRGGAEPDRRVRKGGHASCARSRSGGRIAGPLGRVSRHPDGGSGAMTTVGEDRLMPCGFLPRHALPPIGRGPG
jgi:TPP-dependent pyruvate/acetoin dehydrogenase alpha subunit